MYNILNYGAVSDGVTVNTRAIQCAIDECAAVGGTVMVPAGVFVTGTLWLKDNVELHLSHGAVLKASANLCDYNSDDAYEQNFAYTKEEWNKKHLVIACECSNVSITGTGTIDGNGEAFYDEAKFFEYYCWADGLSLAKDKVNLRPGQLVNFIECDNIKIRDITVKNATAWDIFLYGCRFVQVSGVKIFNPPTYANTDGINIDMCSYVTISDCIIDTGDDAIAIRCNRKFLKNKERITQYITVSNCILGSSSSVFRIGIGDGVIKNVSVSNILMTRGCVGMHFMPAPLNRYASEFESISFTNIIADNICHPFLIEGKMGKVKNITIRDFKANAHANAVISAQDNLVLEDVVLSNISITLSEKYSAENPQMLAERGKTGLLISGVANLVAENIKVAHTDDLNTWEKMVEIKK